MNAGIKKFEAKDKVGVTKELTQMHNMSVFRSIEQDTLTYLVAHAPEGEERQFSERAHVRQWAQAERRHMVEAGDYVANGGNGASVYHGRY
jgi:hypothetical protein